MEQLDGSPGLRDLLGEGTLSSLVGREPKDLAWLDVVSVGEAENLELKQQK
jgi:hypothetical protein